MKARLNLATRPLVSNRRFVVGSATVGGLGLIAMFLLAWHAWSVWRADTALRVQEAQIQTEMNRLQTQRAQLEDVFHQPDVVQERSLAAFLNGLIAERAFPWTNIFMDLERNLPDGVRVISIEPRLDSDHLELRLTIGAMDDAGKLKFLKALEDSNQFSDVQVLSETRSAKPTDSDHVMLSMVARYSAT